MSESPSDLLAFLWMRRILKSRLLEVIGIPLSSTTMLHSDLGLENKSMKIGTLSLSSASVSQILKERSCSPTAPSIRSDWNMNMLKRPL